MEVVLRIIKVIFGIVTVLILIATGGLIVIAVNIFEFSPLVVHQQELKPEDISRAKKLLKENDPRNLQDGAVKSVQFKERDMNLILEYGLRQFSERVRTQVDVENEQTNILVTVGMADNPFGEYLNLTAVVEPEGNFITFRKVFLGSLGIPEWALKIIRQAALENMYSKQRFQPYFTAMTSVNNIAMGNDTLSLNFT